MTLELYRDKKGEWRWNLISKNGRKLMSCADGYKSKQSAQKCLKMVSGYFKSMDEK